MTRKRLEAGDRVDANNGFVGGQRSGRDSAQRRAAVGEPQLAQRLCALLSRMRAAGASTATPTSGDPADLPPRFD